MPILNAGEIATQQAGAPLDVALRQATLSAVAPDHFADIYLGFFLRHPEAQTSDGGMLGQRVSKRRKRILHARRIAC